MWPLSACFLGATGCPRDALLALAPGGFVPAFLTQSIELSLLLSGNGSTAEWIFSSGVFHI